MILEYSSVLIDPFYYKQNYGSSAIKSFTDKDKPSLPLNIETNYFPCLLKHGSVQIEK